MAGENAASPSMAAIPDVAQSTRGGLRSHVRDLPPGALQDVVNNSCASPSYGPRVVELMNWALSPACSVGPS